MTFRGAPLFSSLFWYQTLGKYVYFPFLFVAKLIFALNMVQFELEHTYPKYVGAFALQNRFQPIALKVVITTVILFLIGSKRIN